MWYKVTQLHKDFHLKANEIATKLDLDTRTVEKYLSKSETEFIEYARSRVSYKKSLDFYRKDILKYLHIAESISAASIEDKLKEQYPDFPKVNSKTIYNYVMRIRREENIPRHKLIREYEERLEVPYGQEAQVDFGEVWMQKQDGGRIKVYVFSMVLSRSRYKYLQFGTRKFTTQASVEAHLEAFKFFKGIPHTLLYDQDRVFIKEENLGDYVLTREFESFVSFYKLDVRFCRKADPESKGRIENVIGYIKDNFLTGRIFKDIDTLQDEGVAWLFRRANKKEHGTTQLIPQQEWEIEQEYLRALPVTVESPSTCKAYSVRKTNVVVYKSNTYMLPFGYYKGPQTRVNLSVKDDKVIFKDMENNHLGEYALCHGKGQQISNTNFRRDKSKTISRMKEDILTLYPQGQELKEYIEKIHSDKPRYIRENLQKIRDSIKGCTYEEIKTTVEFCLEHNLMNAQRFSEVLNKKDPEESKKTDLDSKGLELKLSGTSDKADIEPGTSSINLYEAIVAQA